MAHDHSEIGHSHSHDNQWKAYLPVIGSFLLLILGIGFEQTEMEFFKYPVDLIWYIVAYLLVGLKVNYQALKEIRNGNIFSEFFLMSIATIGAFFIGEYSEGVAVMLFYAVGELFQDAAVQRAQRSIKALLDIRPDTVTVIRNGEPVVVNPSEVTIGEIIQMKPGEKVALDGQLISETASFNTAALTGESKPDTKIKGEAVLAGMINLQTLIDVKVTALFRDSKLSRILEMVQEATARKSKTQLFISRFAKIYTPIVVFLAIAIVSLPYLFVENYVFSDWLYRGLVFLVISCPCALVISIPLGYFGGIGLASRNGILFKGSNYLDVMTKTDVVVMDKTGTLTKGIFEVQEVVSAIDQKELLLLTAALESKSTHPIANAIVRYSGGSYKNAAVSEVEEIAGHGLEGIVEGKKVLAGNLKLLKKFNVDYDKAIETKVETIVAVAVDEVYAGYFVIADELKEDAKEAISSLHALNVQTVMLSGDKQSIVDKVAKELGIDTAFGNLLPENKVEKVQELKNQGKTIVFVGDGVNDAPVVALADAGMAMGGLGSDATIETADVVIQNDQPGKIPASIKIGKVTRRIVMQNISLAFGVKVFVLILGAGGLATLWEAVFADVGVALLAILNAVRIQRMKI
ncbi:heavy metal translocating P-type ATPase [Flavobacterium lindanitolerans]|uniref:P-type Zn(2+) transporter n=1 Tax=Flavobacterium lindanitolerans TaxID=428988 RepID=A0A497V2P8_9FLAO|nr:heavy metal translocating P-type ATPase [Flavobacterium lindanitolerans]PKW29521.1 Cd2+/Zn2+-exporting ATPase [Flavobacterium lindanitolerans]RLJ34978.1 Cd2+/Zn2+-exporting ATPase [Flavobacterium lindanitolerans]